LKQGTLEHNAERHTKRQRVIEMADFLKEQGAEIIEYDDKMVRQLVEQVTVHDKQFVVRFKSEIEIEVEL